MLYGVVLSRLHTINGGVFVKWSFLNTQLYLSALMSLSVFSDAVSMLGALVFLVTTRFFYFHAFVIFKGGRVFCVSPLTLMQLLLLTLDSTLTLSNPAYP
jgi:hypothetical protein